MTGHMVDSKENVVNKKESVTTPENIRYVEQALSQSPRKPVVRFSQQPGSIINIQDNYRRCETLSQIQQALCQADEARKVEIYGDLPKTFLRRIQQYSKA